MNHYDRLFWNAYIADNVDATERQHAEAHLLNCESCVTLYLACMEAEQASVPALAPQQCEAMADDVLQALFPKKRWFQQTLFHYAVAASLTLLLMSSGAFDRMTHAVQFTETASSEASLTDRLMQKAEGWLDALGSSWKERMPDHE